MPHDGDLREIQLDILFRQRNRFRRTVYGMNHLSASSHRIERETARITEHIQSERSFA